VRRLPARSVKATKEGTWPTRHAVHHRLPPSCSAQALAGRRVPDNPGRNTPGVDPVGWNEPRRTWRAIPPLRPRGDKARPLRSGALPQPNGTTRPLGIATRPARARPALSRPALAPSAATPAAPNSDGCRQARGCADAMAHGAIGLASRRRPPGRREGDSTACCDTSRHDGLVHNIPMDHRLLRTWRQAGSRDQSVLYPTEAGTPQGGPLRPVLATMALDGLERLRRNQDPQAGPPAAQGKNPHVNLVRSGADVMSTGLSPEGLATEVTPLVRACLQARGVARAPETTPLTPLEDGCDFRGHPVRQDNGPLLTRPSKQNVPPLLTAIRKFLQAHTQAPASGLRTPRNATMRGWAHDPPQASAQAPCGQVATAIGNALGPWAQRRHPKQSARGLAAPDFGQSGTRPWRFFGTARGKDGKKSTHGLGFASATPVTRHHQIQGACHPDDPAGERARAERRGVKREKTRRGRRPLRHRWKAPGGLGPVGAPPITHMPGWHTPPSV
jgi:RNA-directed DNA polymerase